jgi:predicted glycosyltransferase
LGVIQELRPIFKKGYLPHKCRRVLCWRDIPIASKIFRSRGKNWRSEFVSTLKYHYDDIIVFGEKRFLNVAKHFELPDELNNKISYVGYLCGKLPKSDQKEDNKAVVSVGGGENREFAMDVIPKIVDALNIKGYFVDIFGGFYRKIEDDMFGSRVRVNEYTDRYSYLDSVSSAQILVTAGGYNSVVEGLTIGTPQIIICPYKDDRGRTEFGTRAEILQEFGLINKVNPEMSRGKLKDVIDECTYRQTGSLNTCSTKKKITRYNITLRYS